MSKSGKEWFVRGSKYRRIKINFSSVTVISLYGLLIFFILIAGSCIDIKLRMGERPDTDELEDTLRVGESTPKEVLEALGEPHGKGKAMLPIHHSPRTLWSYYYEEVNLQEARRIFLFVFFDQDKYVGYMWFSSLQK